VAIINDDEFFAELNYMFSMTITALLKYYFFFISYKKKKKGRKEKRKMEGMGEKKQIEKN
jgi:hypothetical protein